MGASNSQEISGVRVFRVSPGSPASEAGLEIFFDFIMEVNGAAMDPEHQQSFGQKIGESEGKTAKLLVFNCRSNNTREVNICPRKWGGSGLLGATVRFDTVDPAEAHGIRVLEVFPMSPAAHAGLVPFQDFLLGTGQTAFHDIDELVDAVSGNINQRMGVYVYNSDSESVREVLLTPNNDWGGEGCIGCDIGTGLLHRIPAPRRVPGSVASGVATAAPPPVIPPAMGPAASVAPPSVPSAAVPAVPSGVPPIPTVPGGIPGIKTTAWNSSMMGYTGGAPAGGAPAAPVAAPFAPAYPPGTGPPPGHGAVSMPMAPAVQHPPLPQGLPGGDFPPVPQGFPGSAAARPSQVGGVSWPPSGGMPKAGGAEASPNSPSTPQMSGSMAPPSTPVAGGYAHAVAPADLTQVMNAVHAIAPPTIPAGMPPMTQSAAVL